MDVFGLGQCCLDFLGRIDQYPELDSKCQIQELVTQGGGPVATALVALTRWGRSCALSGVVGDDRFGQEIRRSLEDEGINLTGLATRRRTESQVAFIVAEGGSGHRNVFFRMPTGAWPAATEVDLELLRQAKIFYTDGMFPEASLASAKAAREAGLEVVVDAGSMRPGMLELAALSHHFIVSSAFAKALAPGKDPDEVCQRLSDLGPEVVGVTLGEKGYVALAQGEKIRSSGYQVKARDTTGCGDVFHAGYTHGLLEGWDARERLDFGAWAASQVALSMGGRAGIPDARQWPGVGVEESTQGKTVGQWE